MSDRPDLTLDERVVLGAALERPVSDTDSHTHEVCLRLVAMRLMQRAGGVTVMNGWHGSPDAYVLTHDGWSLLAADRRRGPVRRFA